MVTFPALPSKVLALKPRLRNHLLMDLNLQPALCQVPPLRHLCEFSDYIIMITLLVAFR